MKLALVQLDVDLGRDPDKSRELAAAKVQEATEDGAELVVLPELWLHGAFDPAPWADTAEPMHGETARFMQQTAVDCGVLLHMGSIVERTPDGKLYNTSLMFDAEGGLLGGYRKIHRFGFDQGEAAVMSPGEHLTTFPLLGDEDEVLTTVGLATCYDLRFPEMYRKLIDAGAETVLQVASWPLARVEHWRTLTIARAIEDQVFLVACGAVGTQAGQRMAGHSMVVDPWGAVVAEAGEDETILYAEIDFGQVAETRAKFPVLPTRRL